MALGDLSKKSRGKLLADAAALLPPGTVVRELAVGRAHARWTTLISLAIGGVVLVVAVAAAAGLVVMPGFVVAYAFDLRIRPRRAVVECDQGIASIAMASNHRLSKVVALVDHNPMAWAQSSTTRRLRIGPDSVKFTPSEFGLIAAVQHHRTMAAMQHS